MLRSLLFIPIAGVFIIFTGVSLDIKRFSYNQWLIKGIGLTISILNFLLSLIIFILFDFSSNLFQFVEEYHDIGNYDLYLGIDGLSVYFVLLTTLITPIVFLSN
jgi:NADH:ubiquinone oxidoreductase subunit 4 (subunit M)